MEDSLRLEDGDDDPLPAELAGDDVRFPPKLVEHFLQQYTGPGDLVLDPFAGFGTTAVVAERMGRRAVCVEVLPERAAFIERVAPTAEVIEGDARDLARLVRQRVDFVMTSPPYMTRNDHPQDPMTGYRSLDGDYERYLADLRDVFDEVRALLRPGGHVVIDVANLLHAGVTTELAFDVKAVVEHVLVLEREVHVLTNDHPPHITDEYCLIFRR